MSVLLQHPLITVHANSQPACDADAVAMATPSASPDDSSLPVFILCYSRWDDRGNV